MAADFFFHSGSALCGSPIVLTATSDSLSTPNPAFHRLVITVYAKLTYNDNSASSLSEFSFSAAVTDKETVQMDISSALRTVTENWERDENALTCPNICYYATAHDEWMMNGQNYASDKIYLKKNKSDNTSTQQNFYAYMGTVSRNERLRNKKSISENNNMLPIQYLSTKPSSGEVVPLSFSLIQPSPLSQSVLPTSTTGLFPSSTEMTFSSTGIQTISSVCEGGKDRTVFVTDSSDFWFLFRFFNKRGVMESIAAHALPEVKIKLSNDSFSSSAFESFTEIPQTVVRKYNLKKNISMSSGPLNKEWQEWWVNDFLQTEYAWIYDNGFWMPCSIVPEEELDIKDYSKSEVREMTFTVQMEG